MASHRASSLLDPTSAVAAITKHKAEAMRLAREQSAAIQEMCRRAKTESPPYEFEELIGKGAYGRVYKGHQLPSRKVVALKVMDIDSMDYQTPRDFKDESIKDFIHETKVMKQVKDSGAKNINELIEAISIHSQLWLVCEYCPGGSVRTLMRATGDRLDERFIIPVARELAIGLKAIHDAGIIHRDIKAANVLIHEEGRLQICDFGVAGVLQSHVDKRSTWIGTPHWMPPEMFSMRGEAHQYSSEIDVWAYGCTLIEFATGNPPNANLRERMQIGRQLNRAKPKLDKEGYSDGLKDLVSFALDSDPKTRPTMADIVSHSFIAGTEESHPTSSLGELVRVYYQWSQRGGQRISLFNPGGAVAAEFPNPDEDTFGGDWNFSTTDNFERRFSVINLDELAASLAEMEDEISPTTVPSEKHSLDEPRDMEMSTDDKANFDERVRRGAEAMEGLFNEEMPNYTYETKNDFVPVEDRQPPSDLPLRTETDRSSVTSTFIDIDIGSFDSSHYAAGATTAQPIQLVDADTIKANRSSGRQQRNSNEARSRSSSNDVGNNRDSEDLTFQPQTGPRPPTMDWKFPGFMQVPQDEEPESKPEEDGGDSTPEAESTEPNNQADKRATLQWTFPVMATQAGEEDNSVATDPSRFETLRAPLVSGPSTQSDTVRPISIGEPGDDDEEEVDDDHRPSTSHSTHSSIAASSETDYDPFRLDRPIPISPSAHRAPSVIEDDFPEIIDMDSNDEYDHENEVGDDDDDNNDDDDQYPTILDGPGPDEEDSDTIAWSDDDDGRPSAPTPDTTITTSSTATATASKPNTRTVSISEPFPTAIPSDASTGETGTPYDSPIPDPTARIPRMRSRAQKRPRDGLEPVQFPDLVPPSTESLVAGVEDGVLAGELDRLLGDFLDALTATGDAMNKVTSVGSVGGGARRSGNAHGHGLGHSHGHRSGGRGGSGRGGSGNTNGSGSGNGLDAGDTGNVTVVEEE